MKARILLLPALLIMAVKLSAGTYSASGVYQTAVYNIFGDIIGMESRVYSATLGDDVSNGASATVSNCEWIARTDVPYTEVFNISTLLWPHWSIFTGTISLEIAWTTASGVPQRATVMTVIFSGGAAIGYVPSGSVGSYVTGYAASDRAQSLAPERLQTVGGPVVLASGAESASRPLFSFRGTRDWDFTLRYHSTLARAQVGNFPLGMGWTHDYQARIVPSGGNLRLRWTPNRANIFAPDADNPSVFRCADDATRYDTITAQSGGGWILTRRDQSALVFNASGFLVEDRDPQGRKLVLTYVPGDDKIARIADPVSGTFLDFVYDGAGRVAQLVDNSGAQVGLTYFSTLPRRIQSITNQRGKVATFDYNPATMALLTLTDDTGAVLTTNTYDAAGRVVSQNDGVSGNQLLTFAYEEQAFPGKAVYAASDTAKNVPILLSAPGTPRLDSLGNNNGQTVTYAYDSSNRVVSATLNGQTTTVQYDADGLIVSVTDPAGQVTPISPRIVTSFTDRLGKQSVHTFDANYNLLLAKDELNHTTTYTYDSANRITSVTDPLNRTTTYTYDSRGNLLTATDPAGKVTTFTYDARNNLLTTTDPVGGVTTRTYDASNNLLTLTDALGRTTTWTYDANSLPLTMTLPGGGVTTYAYTAGRLTQVTDPQGVITQFGYDALGRLLYREDALGKRVTFTYDALGNVLTVVNATGQTTTHTYDHRNRVATVTDPAGAVTTNTYDHNSNLLTATVTATGLPTLVTTYTYDGEDRLKTVTTPDPDTTATGAGKDPLVTTYNYDDAGRLTSVVAPAGTTTYAYDAASQLVTITDPDGKATTSEYNTRGLLTKVTDPLTRATNLSYDDAGRRKTANDPLSRLTTLEYDALHRVTKVTDPGALVAQQGFDLNGNRTSLTNPANAATAFAYDSANRLVTETTPLGRATGYTYNTRGLLATATEPSTQQTTFAYDDSQRLSSTTDPVGTITLGRDTAGRVTTVTEGAKTITRAYNAYGWLTSFTDGDGNTISYTYDNLGRLTKLTYPGTPTKEVLYAYDAAGRLSTVIDWASRVTTYSYDAVSRLSQILRPNGTKQVRTYDAAGQLTALTEYAPDGTTVIYSGAHTYDLAGQLTGETLIPGLAPPAVSATQTFDADNRLLTHNGAAVTFDADGNLLTIASGVAPASYTYDARNRLTSAGGLSYGYDAENRRVSVTDAGGTTSYVINPNAVPDQVLVKTAPDGTKTFYVYGLGLLHEETASTVRYYHHDRRGDTIALTDNTGAVTDRVAYGVYGEIISRTGTTSTPFLFNGRWGVQTDANGLYHHRARYYHPQLRRFLNQDTVLGSITSGASMNRFAYANGNPVSLIDPFGLMAQDADPKRSLAALLFYGPNDYYGLQQKLGTLALLVAQNWRERFYQAAYAASDGDVNYAAAQADVMLLMSGEVLGAGAPALSRLLGPAAEKAVPSVVYRGGKPSPSNLKPRPVDQGDLSFRDSLSNPLPRTERPVFRPGDDYFGIDTSKLPPGSVIPDNIPPGHVTIRNVPPEVLKDAVIERGRFP